MVVLALLVVLVAEVLAVGPPMLAKGCDWPNALPALPLLRGSYSMGGSCRCCAGGGSLYLLLLGLLAC